MDFNKLKEKRDYVAINKNKLSQGVLENYSDSFDVNFTHNQLLLKVIL
ncbi:MAG: hypothetical protein PHX04_01500 [Bacilli bacterium]|nr:hypothetical protein [Bacilli bacterium]